MSNDIQVSILLLLISLCILSQRVSRLEPFMHHTLSSTSSRKQKVEPSKDTALTYPIIIREKCEDVVEDLTARPYIPSHSEVKSEAM